MCREIESDKKSLERVQTHQERTSIQDHILNIFKAGLASAPFCGGIASLISDYIPSSKFERLERFSAQVADDLNRLSERVRDDYLRTDEFAYMFENCLKGASANYQQEKLDSFRGLLVNSAIRTDISGDEREYFLKLVDTLTVLHIKILRFMFNPHDYCRATGIPIGRITGGFEHFSTVAIPNVNIEVIKSAFDDLYHNGLITNDKSIFGTMTHAQGLDLLENRVTDFGKRFISYCMTPR